MPADLLLEERVPLRDVPALISGPPHLSTVKRWVQRAEDPLETFRVGRRVFSTHEAIARFNAKSNPAPTRRQRAIIRSRAEAEAQPESETEMADV